MLRGWAVAVALGLALPTTAAADEWSLHLLGDALTAWTDNVFSVPSDQPAGATPHEADVYYQVRPGALFTYQTPRATQELSYQLEYNMYTRHREAWSAQHRAGWRGHYLTSPRGEVGGHATFSTGQLNTFSIRTTADAGQVVVVPNGSTHFTQAEGGQDAGYSVTPELRLSQTTLARRFENEDDFNTISTGTEVGGTVGADYSWRADAIGVVAGASYVVLERLAAGMVESTEQLNLLGLVNYRRDLDRFWSVGADAGLVAILPSDHHDETLLQPTFGGMVAYAPEWGSATVTARRSVTPNLLIAENTINESFTATAALPLPWLHRDGDLPALSFLGTLGAQRSRVIDGTTGDTATGFKVWLADLAFQYAPRAAYAFTLRYQLVKQTVDRDAMADSFGYTRHTVELSVAARWPEQVAGTVPDRQSSRVDQSDTSRGREESQGK